MNQTIDFFINWFTIGTKKALKVIIETKKLGARDIFVKIRGDIIDGKTDFDEKSELIGNFKLRNSKNKKSAEEVAKKILKSYESFDDVFHSSILMKFLFFLKNIFPRLINYILKFFFK